MAIRGGGVSVRDHMVLAAFIMSGQADSRNVGKGVSANFIDLRSTALAADDKNQIFTQFQLVPLPLSKNNLVEHP
jgi:hypothetical protein